MAAPGSWQGDFGSPRNGALSAGVEYTAATLDQTLRLLPSTRRSTAAGYLPGEIEVIDSIHVRDDLTAGMLTAGDGTCDSFIVAHGLSGTYGDVRVRVNALACGV